jgi:hypothetical protein
VFFIPFALVLQVFFLFKMKFALKSRIRTFLSTILHAVKMTSTPQSTYFDLPTGPGLHVQAYHNLLMMGYEGHDDERMNAMCVTELRLLKQLKKSSGHEYVMASITTPDGSTKYLAIERHPGDLSDSAPAQSDTSLPPIASEGHARVKSSSLRIKLQPRPFSTTSSITSLDSSSPKRDARDVIQVLDKPVHNNNDTCYGKLEFTSSNPLYLYQLVTLALTLHESQTCYRLFSTNCYWFAGLLVDAVEKIYDMPFVNEEGQRWVQAGTWNAVPVYKKAPDDVIKTIIEEHSRCMKTFKHTVSLSNL